MSVQDPVSNPLWLNAVLLALVAAAIWTAGSRLSEIAKAIAARTGLSQAFVGVLILAVTTSLPEIAVVITASLAGSAPLAANNLLGGIVFQTAILAAADVVALRGALSFFTPQPVLMLQGILIVALPAILLAASNSRVAGRTENDETTFASRASLSMVASPRWRS